MQKDEVARLARESGLEPRFVDEIGFWALELSGHGYHPEVLDRAMPKRMATCFPPVLYTWLEKLKQQRSAIPRVVDVGSGPLSLLAHGVQQHLFELTAVDPLADVYRRLLGKYRLELDYPLLPVWAEKLAEEFGSNHFDIVWTRNAIDHSHDPAQAFRSMADALAPGGYLFLGLNSREGTAESFHGLHRHDIYLDAANRLMLESMSDESSKLSRPVCMSDGLSLELVESSGPTPGIKQWFEVVWTKTA